jgi:hypothetical protein
VQYSDLFLCNSAKKVFSALAPKCACTKVRLHQSALAPKCDCTTNEKNIVQKLQANIYLKMTNKIFGLD